MAKDVDFEDIKRAIVEGQKKKELTPKKKRKEEVKTVEDIVRRIREKYEKEGAYVRDEEADTEIEIKKILTPELAISGSPEDLAEFENPIVRFIGKIYLRFQSFFDRVLKAVANQSYVKSLDWDLYAANLPFTGIQYLTFILVLSFLLAVVAFILSVPVFVVSSPPIALLGPFAVAFFTFILVYVFGRSYPRNRAFQRSREAEKYLPFALRHLAVEIRAGMGLYQAMRAVANADYGVLSEEFERTLKEIDEGKSMEVALSNLAERMRTKGMKRAVANIIRAIRIGGNLSNTIMDIARDVSFEQRMRVAEYGEKLNFFSVIFMFVAVVFPIMIGMISAIGNAPVGAGFLKAFQLPENLLIVTYLVAFPGFLLLFMYFIRISDPMR